MKEEQHLRSATLLDKGKGTTYQNQLQTLFHYLKNHVATASMVTGATGLTL